MSDTLHDQIRRIVLQRLESLARAGVSGLPLPSGEGAPAGEWRTSNEAHRASNVQRRTSNEEHRTSNAKRGTLDAEREALSEQGTGTPVVPPVEHPASHDRSPEAPSHPPAAAPGSMFSREFAMGPRGSMSRQKRVELLAEVCREVAACHRCQELASTRTQTVFGVGTPTPRLVFVGEAPGAEEDAQGEPFVGRAGQLLNKILEACTLRREDVYILNILKCHPPGNRTPLPHEVENCREYLLRQLAILEPEFVCCLGAVASQTMLETTKPIGQLRGRFHQFHGIRVMATYHPAYLLRNPDAKRATWEDMKMLMREMGITLPQR